MKTLLGLLVLLWATPAWAGWLCTDKATGIILEYQDPGTPGICVRNLTQAGVATDTIVEREVTLAEFAVLNDTQVLAPQRAAAATKASQAATRQQAAATRIQQKLGLTDNEFQDLRDALREAQ